MNGKRIAQIFIVVSILFIGTLCAIYGYRLVHYYKIEHPKVEEEKDFASILTDIGNIVTTGNGLYKEENSYYYKGLVSNNYIKYSGLLWRIVRINEDHSITMISEENMTSMVSGYEADSFEDSYAYQWLNETFYDMIQNTDYLVDTSYCADFIKDADDVNCVKKQTSKVGMINVYEYLKASGSKGYLNTGKNFWTVNPSSDHKTWFVNQKGLVSNESILGASYHSYGIRPVVSLKGDIVVTGTGTLEDPYMVKENVGTTLKDQTIGSYVSYSDQTWRIIEKHEEGVTLALNGYIKVREEEIRKAFSNESNLYNTSEIDNLGYYLNTEYYATLKNPEYLVDHIWKGFYYNSNHHYNYKAEDFEVTAKIGLLKIGDLFIDHFSEYALMTPTNEEDGTIFTVLENGRMYANMVTELLKIRPTIVLKGSLNIQSGTGTSIDPFVLGEA